MQLQQAGSSGGQHALLASQALAGAESIPEDSPQLALTPGEGPVDRLPDLLLIQPGRLCTVTGQPLGWG